MLRRKYFCLSAVTLSVFSLWAGGDGKTGTASSSAPEAAPGSPRRLPTAPVLRKTEPEDNHFVLLPGAPRTATAATVAVPAPPAEPAAPLHKPFVAPAFTLASIRAITGNRSEPEPPALEQVGRPYLRRSVFVVYPAEFEQDSGMFCQRQIGHWTHDDAAVLLGAPSANRPAYGEKHTVNGLIYAFDDPTHRYRQLELDFDGETGALRTVFIYPWKMTWGECRRIWGTNVSAAEANQGRKFYSYLNRRVDVLVDAAGRVISIGLY